VHESATHQNSTNRIYMDNAATSFPKPVEVTQSMVDYARNIGASAGRGAYAEARQSARVIQNCRTLLARLFNGENPNHFIFTLNCTDALNMAIHGWLNPGDHAVCIAMDHNSILRPLNELVAHNGITQTRIEVDPQTGLAEPEDIRKALRPQTRLIALGHASNVTGTVQNIQQIGLIARESQIAFLVDAAQSAGHLPIDVIKDRIDFLACPGHKGLLGPLGTGFLYIRPGLENQLRTRRQGGTGSVSQRDVQPEFMPDRFEPGSHNAIGIAGLAEGINWILRRGVNEIARHERELCTAFIEAVQNIEGLRFFGPNSSANRVGVFSIRIDGFTPLELSEQLEKEFGILTRAGLHCAPLAHQAIGTFSDQQTESQSGTTRLSFGVFTQKSQVQFAAEALATLAARKIGKEHVGSAV